MFFFLVETKNFSALNPNWRKMLVNCSMANDLNAISAATRLLWSDYIRLKNDSQASKLTADKIRAGFIVNNVYLPDRLSNCLYFDMFKYQIEHPEVVSADILTVGSPFPKSRKYYSIVVFSLSSHVFFCMFLLVLSFFLCCFYCLCMCLLCLLCF